MIFRIINLAILEMLRPISIEGAACSELNKIKPHTIIANTAAATKLTVMVKELIFSAKSAFDNGNDN